MQLQLLGYPAGKEVSKQVHGYGLLGGEQTKPKVCLKHSRRMAIRTYLRLGGFRGCILAWGERMVLTMVSKICKAGDDEVMQMDATWWMLLHSAVICRALR